MPDDVLKTIPKTKAFSPACDVQAWVESCLDGWRPQQDGYYYPEMLYEDDGTLSESRLMLAARYATEKNRLRRWWIGWWHDGKHYLKCAYQWQLIYGLQGNTQVATTLSQKLSQAMKQWTGADDAHVRAVPTPAQIFNWRQFAFFRSPMPLGQFSKNLSDGLAPFIRLSELMQIRDRLHLPADWQKRIDFEGDRIDGSPIQDVAERVRAYQRRGWFGRLWMRWWTDRGIQAQQRLYFYYQAQWTQTMVRQASSSSDSHDRLVTLPLAYASVKACLEKKCPQEKRSIPRIAYQVASLPEMAMDGKYPILSPSQMCKAQRVVSQGLRRDWQAFQMHALGLWQRRIRQRWQELLDFFANDFDGSRWDVQRERVDKTLRSAQAQLSQEHSFFKSLIQATARAHSHQLKTLDTLLKQGEALMKQSNHANQLWGGTFKPEEILGHAQYYRKLIAQCQAYPQTLLMPGHQLFQSAHGCLTRRFASLVAEQQAMLVVQTPKIREALIAEMSALCREFRAEGGHWARWDVDVNSMAELDRRLETLEQGELSQRYACVCWTLEFLNEQQMDAGGEKVVCSEDLTASRQHWLSQQVQAIANEIDGLDEQFKADAKDSVEDDEISARGELQVPMARWHQWMRLYERYETLQTMLQKVEVNPSQGAPSVEDALKRLQQSLSDWLKAHCVAMGRDLRVLSEGWTKQSNELERLKHRPYDQKRMMDDAVWRDRHTGKYDTVLSEELYQRHQWTYRLLQRLGELTDIKLYELLEADVTNSFHTWFEFRYQMIEDELRALGEQVRGQARVRGILEDRFYLYDLLTSLEGSHDKEALSNQRRRNRQQGEGVHCIRLMDPGWEESAFIERCLGLREALKRMKICVSWEAAQGYLVQLEGLWEASVRQQLERMQTQLTKFGQGLKRLVSLARGDWFNGGSSWSKMQWLMRQAQMRQQYNRLNEWLSRWDVGDWSYDERAELTTLRNRLETIWREGCAVSQYWEALWTQEAAWRGFWQALKQHASLRFDGGANELSYEDKREGLRQSLMGVLSSSNVVAPATEIPIFIDGLLEDFEERLGQVYSSVSEWRDKSDEWSLESYLPGMQSKTLLYRREIFELVGQGKLLQYAIFCTLASLKLTIPKTVCIGVLIQQVQDQYGLACHRLQKEVKALMCKLHPDRDPDITVSHLSQEDVDPKTCTNIAALERRYKDVILAYYNDATAEETQKCLSLEKRALELRLRHLYATRKNEALPHHRESEGFTILERLKSELIAFSGFLESGSKEIEDLESAVTDVRAEVRLGLRLRLSGMPIEAMSLAERVALLWVAPERYETMWWESWQACQMHQSTLSDWGQNAAVGIFIETLVIHAKSQSKVDNLFGGQMTMMIKQEEDKRRQIEMEIAHLKKQPTAQQTEALSPKRGGRVAVLDKNVSVSGAVQVGLFNAHAQPVGDTEKQEDEVSESASNTCER
ncbi:MAG: hypothetical protein GKR77_03850 [Legionellales bacterium]|nr:hypothetical protein [Legionellales bacterium]